MNLFSIRVLSSLMVATNRQWETTLAERTAEVPYGAITYGPVIRGCGLILRHGDRAASRLETLSNPINASAKLKTFRQRAFEHVSWFKEIVAPRILSVLRDLEGDRRKSHGPFKIDGSPVSGGPHWLVEWEDGSQRLVYVVGPKWSRKRIRALMVLLQLYAISVHSMNPRSVVIVDLRRHEVIELQDLPPEGEDSVIKTIRVLRKLNLRRTA